MTAVKLPNFIIIGAQKSASTYVHLMLREHPDVCMPAEEIRFFEDPDYGDGDPGSLADLFADCDAPLRGIKRPDYLARPEVPPRIKQLLPAAKLIAVLREPIARFFSAYHYYIKIGLLPAVPIEQGAARLLAGGDDMGSIRAPELLEYGRYATHLERYQRLFPPEQLYILLQEDIIRDESSTLRQLREFLGLGPYPEPPVVARDNAGLYSLPRLKFLRLRNRVLYDYTEHTHKLIPKKGFLRYAAAGAITAVDRYALAPFFPNRKPAISASLRQQLVEFYAPEVSRLEILLDRPLEGWK